MRGLIHAVDYDISGEPCLEWMDKTRLEDLDAVMFSDNSEGFDPPSPGNAMIGRR